MKLSHLILDLCVKLGVKVAVLCSGSRNKFLVNSLVQKLKVVTVPDERSAGFFSLGINKTASSLASLVCVTSGTAVAELFPSLLEAYYSGTPFLVLSADLPKRFSGTGFPQSINQRNFFGEYAEYSEIDFESKENLVKLSMLKPNHWNIRYWEDDIEIKELKFELINQGPQGEKSSISKIKKPIAIVSMLDKDLINITVNFLTKTKIPVLVDPFNDKELKSKIPSELRLFTVPDDFKSVLRIGRVPSLRIWRDLFRKKDFLKKQIFVCSQDNFQGGDRVERFLSFSELQNLEIDQLPIISKFTKYAIPQKTEHAFMQRILNNFAEFTFFVGNSSPAYTLPFLNHYSVTIFGNRGVNGIDGLVSTFAGCAYNLPCIGIVGDLSFLYDLQGLLLLKFVKKPWILFIINNGGGLIFDYFNISKKMNLKARQVLVSPYSADLSKIVKGFGLSFAQIDSERKLDKIRPFTVVEIIPDVKITQRFWRELDCR